MQIPGSNEPYYILEDHFMNPNIYIQRFFLLQNIYLINKDEKYALYSQQMYSWESSVVRMVLYVYYSWKDDCGGKEMIKEEMLTHICRSELTVGKLQKGGIPRKRFFPSGGEPLNSV